MKNIRLAVLFGLIAAILLSLSNFDARCQDLRENVFRLHIIANSNNEADQELKLKVRDAILLISEDMYKKAETTNQAIDITNANTNLILKTAKQVIKDNGYNYDVKINVGKAYFTNREYEKFTLPAGEYNALNIIIGEGKGKNWWCVMFPAMCIGAASELNSAVSDVSAEIATNPNNYVFKFKTVEIYENIRNYFKK